MAMMESRTYGGMRRRASQFFYTIFTLSALLIASSTAHAGSILDRVKRDGQVRCGVDQTAGFSDIDATGRPTGFEVDFCRAVAAAVLGNADAIVLSRVRTANKFKALVDDEIDIGLGQATWTLTRDTSLGVWFPVALFYDGQGFMVWSDIGAKRLGDLAGKSICVQGGTTSFVTLREAVASLQPAPNLIEFATSEEKSNGFLGRRCDAVTGDRSELTAMRASSVSGGGRLVLLPDVVSREPLGPVVANRDLVWGQIVRWVGFALIAAEARGLTSESIRSISVSPDGEIRRLAGLEPGVGRGLELDDRWARRVIEQVGNYGQIFARNLGLETRIGLDRGQNALWLSGGLIFSPPFR